MFHQLLAQLGKRLWCKGDSVKLVTVTDLAQGFLLSVQYEVFLREAQAKTLKWKHRAEEEKDFFKATDVEFDEWKRKVEKEEKMINQSKAEAMHMTLQSIDSLKSDTVKKSVFNPSSCTVAGQGPWLCYHYKRRKRQPTGGREKRSTRSLHSMCRSRMLKHWRRTLLKGTGRGSRAR